MEDQKLWPNLACNQDFAKRRGKMYKLGNVLGKLVLVKRITDEEAVSDFWKKKTILMSLNHISLMLRAIWKN